MTTDTPTPADLQTEYERLRGLVGRHQVDPKIAASLVEEHYRGQGAPCRVVLQMTVAELFEHSYVQLRRLRSVSDTRLANVFPAIVGAARASLADQVDREPAGSSSAFANDLAGAAGANGPQDPEEPDDPWERLHRRVEAAGWQDRSIVRFLNSPEPIDRGDLIAGCSVGWAIELIGTGFEAGGGFGPVRQRRVETAIAKVRDRLGQLDAPEKPGAESSPEADRTSPRHWWSLPIQLRSAWRTLERPPHGCGRFENGTENRTENGSDEDAHRNSALLLQEVGGRLIDYVAMFELGPDEPKASSAPSDAVLRHRLDGCTLQQTADRLSKRLPEEAETITREFVRQSQVQGQELLGTLVPDFRDRMLDLLTHPDWEPVREPLVRLLGCLFGEKEADQTHTPPRSAASISEQTRQAWASDARKFRFTPATAAAATAWLHDRFPDDLPTERLQAIIDLPINGQPLWRDRFGETGSRERGEGGLLAETPADNALRVLHESGTRLDGLEIVSQTGERASPASEKDGTPNGAALAEELQAALRSDVRFSTGDAKNKRFAPAWHWGLLADWDAAASASRLRLWELSLQQPRSIALAELADATIAFLWQRQIADVTEAGLRRAADETLQATWGWGLPDEAPTPTVAAALMASCPHFEKRGREERGRVFFGRPFGPSFEMIGGARW